MISNADAPGFLIFGAWIALRLAVTAYLVAVAFLNDSWRYAVIAGAYVLAHGAVSDIVLVVKILRTENK